MAGKTPVQVIKQWAPKFNLDPYAVIAYAMTQGGLSWGAVGDKGTSFGPFQAHIGGAAGKRTPKAAAAWANSPAGLVEMMHMMAKAGAAGKTGPEAAAFIVGPSFGRGANPKQDMANARAAYGRAVGGGGDVPKTDYGSLAFGNSNFKVIGTPGVGTHNPASGSAGANWESDNAWDYAVPVGTPVYATESGTIGSQIGVQKSRPKDGSRVHLDGANNSFFYAHLSKVVVKAGQQVTAGTLIGYTGTSQNGVAHLHLGVKNLDASVPDQSSPDLSAGDVSSAAPSDFPSIDFSSGQLPGLTGGQAPPGSADVGTPQGRSPQETWQLISTQPFTSPDTQALLPS